MDNEAIPREVILILLITIFVVLFVVAAFIVNFWIPFIKQRNYIKMEIRRSDGEEKKYYERQLKLFYASHVPLVRRFIFKREEKRRDRKKS